MLNENGQNNTVIEVNNTLIFRFPKYQQGIADLQAETRLLQFVDKYITLDIPKPIYLNFESQVVGDICRLPYDTGKMLRHENLSRYIKIYRGRKLVLGTHGAVMTLMMGYYDNRYDLNFLLQTSKPDVYRMEFNDQVLVEVKRMWNITR